MAEGCGFEGGCLGMGIGIGVEVEVEGLDGFAEEVHFMKFIWMDGWIRWLGI